MDESVPLVTILRRALLISRTLDAGSMDEWIGLEIDGYPKGVERPAYRKVRGTVKANDAFAGLIPMRLPDEDWAISLSTVTLYQGVGTLASMLEKSSGELAFQVPAATAQVFIDDDPDIVGIVVFIVDGALVGVLGTIRQRLFDWALSLEARGITGAGRSFSRPQLPQNPQVIHQMTTNNYENISQSQIMTGSSGTQTLTAGSDLSQLLEVLREAQGSIGTLRLTDQAKSVAEEDVATAIAQASSPAPRMGILRESLKSVRAILEGAAGEVIASGLLAKIDAAAKAIGLY